MAWPCPSLSSSSPPGYGPRPPSCEAVHPQVRRKPRRQRGDTAQHQEVGYNLLCGSRRLAPLPARGPAPSRACTPASAPLQPNRRPRRAHSDEPPDVRGEVRRGWGDRFHGSSHLPGPSPASSKTRGPLVLIPGQVQSPPELPTNVRPPDHARPQTGQATGQTRSADLALRPQGLRPAVSGKFRLDMCREACGGSLAVLGGSPRDGGPS